MYNVSVSPHVRAKTNTKTIMRDVAIALLPTICAGIYHFGYKAALLTVISVVSCVGFEALYEFLAKKDITVFDYSAVVTGLILAVNLPAGVPWYFPVLGSAFAIIIVKMLFGGLGQNFINPALAGRCFLAISFASKMNEFTYDGITGPTPLALMRAGKQVDIDALLIGSHGGCIGEVSVIAILIGFLYLLLRRVINANIPFTYLASTIVFIAVIRLLKGDDVTVQYLLGQLFSGGLLIGATFMANDYVTSPITSKGQVLYGLLLGLMTALFRTVGSTSEGVSYSIIFANLLVPLIEKVTAPRPFGCERTRGGNQ